MGCYGGFDTSSANVKASVHRAMSRILPGNLNTLPLSRTADITISLVMVKQNQQLIIC